MNQELLLIEYVRDDTGNLKQTRHITRADWEKAKVPEIIGYRKYEDGRVVTDKITTREAVEYLLHSGWMVQDYLKSSIQIPTASVDIPTQKPAYSINMHLN